SLLGWLLLNETLNSNFFIGGILIICSVLITTFEKK
ncbi:EamA family transporter, partial [Bacillus cereus]|nr:EamA family transporter [Bacillus cereus]